MSFLRINGYVLPVVDGGAHVSRSAIGDATRTYSGAWTSTIRATKRRIEVETPPLAAALADALVGLVMGRGHVWHFNDATNWQYSTKGLGKSAGSGSSLASGKFGRGVRIAAGGSLTWATELPTDYTLMVWYYTSGAWHHYIVRSDAAKWVDGVRNDAASTPFLSVSSGSTVLGDTGAAGNQDFDDLVALPYLVHADMATTWGVAAAAFSDLSTLNVSGDVFFTSTNITMRWDQAASVDEEILQAVIDGTFTAAARRVSFALEET